MATEMAEVEEVSERHTNALCGGRAPSLGDLLNHHDKFGGDARDYVASANHLPDDQVDILRNTIERREKAARKERYT